jgi:hypothetical protein
LVGGVVVAGFGPLVRSQVESRAAALGATVEIERVAPTLSGVRLRGVGVEVADLPGVKVRLDDVLVGWTGARDVTLKGGTVRAVGSPAELLGQLERWRDRYLKRRAGGGGGGRSLDLGGLSVDWRDRPEDPTHRLQAKGVAIDRSGRGLRLAAASLEGRVDGTSLEATNGSVLLVRGEAGYRIAELSSEALQIAVELDGQAAGSPLDGADGPPSSASAQPSSSVKAPLAGSAATAVAAAPPDDAAPHPRVRAARATHRALVGLAERVSGLFESDAQISLAGVRGIVRTGDDALNLGPGTLSFERDQQSFLVTLAPSPDEDVPRGDAPARALTFSVQIPLPTRGASPDRAVVATVHGGPVWLSTLGIREGDFGLRDVGRASVEADATVKLPADGHLLSLDGRGKLRKLSVASPRLAREPLEDVELAWQAKADISLDGARIQVHAGEVDLGEIRVLFAGSYDRNGDDHKVAMTYEVPLVGCQQAFESLPKAMVPKLAGMRFAGSVAMKGHARFDTAKLASTYDVDWHGAYSCRIVGVPEALRADRFRSPFKKLVYTPDGKEQTMEFGPGTAGWTPYESISRFMDGAVLTCEDGRFYRHNGFDQEAIVNSLEENIRQRRFVRGASTISMQLARNLYLRRDRRISRKLQEAILTAYLEQEFTKREMMELYLNVIEFGPMVYGVGPAAKHYFNTTAGGLSLGQSMYLASILPQPQKHYFGAGGAVTASWMKYLHRLMKILHKIRRISDEELEVGLRETVVFGSPSPRMAPPAEDDVYPDETGAPDVPDPTAP